MVNQDDLLKWLSNQVNEGSGSIYRHRHMLEADRAHLETVKPQLKTYVQQAHADAKARFQRFLDTDSLDPLEPRRSDHIDYPGSLPSQTLMGYFGEVMAGLLAQTVTPFAGDQWYVPAFLFRFHEDARSRLYELRMMNRDGQDTSRLRRRPIIGRHQDDCLAFRFGPDGKIIASLVCEAKCLQNNNQEKVDEAYEKVSQGPLIPVSLPQLIEIMESSSSQHAQQWVDALWELHLRNPLTHFQRHNFITYICGTKPNQQTGSYLPKDHPNPKYVGHIPLEVAEVSIKSLRDLVWDLYDATETA